MNTFLKRKNPFFGLGFLQGLWVTLKNFIESYYRSADKGGIFTIQYPEERAGELEATRNFPFLVYDETPDRPRCTACGICERECPVKCIHIVMARDAAGKPARKPASFEIDHTLCMNCGMCEEVCPFDSIFMDHRYEIASGDRNTLMMALPELLKPNAYFHTIRPWDATQVDKSIKAAQEKKAAVSKPAAPPPEGKA